MPITLMNVPVRGSKDGILSGVCESLFDKLRYGMWMKEFPFELSRIF